MTKRHLLLALLAAAFLAAFAVGQSLGDRMSASSAVVLSLVKENGEFKPIDRGAAFFVGPRQLVTEYVTCCGKTKSGQETIPAVIKGEGGEPARVVWQEGQIAVIAVDKDMGGSPVPVAPAKLVSKGQPVYTVQLAPKAAPRVTQGKVVDVGKLESGALVIVTTAPMLEDNLGGGLFDACGNAIGVNAHFDAKEGRMIAFALDPLIRATNTGVEVRVASEPCGESGSGEGDTGDKSSGAEKGDGGGKQEEPEEPPEWRLPQGQEWILVVFLLAIALLAFRPSTRQRVVRAITRRSAVPVPAPYPPPAPVPVATKPALRGITGQYAGSSISLEQGSSTLGRDPRSANLVFASEADSVSKRHCTIRWDAARRLFVLEDHGSTNGTFLASGERLAPNTPRDLRPGERFYIGDLRNQFEVRME